MTRFESKQKQILQPAVVIYSYLSDFNNIGKSVPTEHLENFRTTSDTCSFSTKEVGELKIKISERQPEKLVKFESIEGSRFEFKCWLQIKQVDYYDTRIKITLDVKLGIAEKLVAKKHLQNFVEMLAEQITNAFNKVYQN